MFTKEESEPLDFRPGPEYVWCWGWDGAGDLEGPDADPIWASLTGVLVIYLTSGQTSGRKWTAENSK